MPCSSRLSADRRRGDLDGARPPSARHLRRSGGSHRSVRRENERRATLRRSPDRRRASACGPSPAAEKLQLAEIATPSRFTSFGSPAYATSEARNRGPRSPRHPEGGGARPPAGSADFASAVAAASAALGELILHARKIVEKLLALGLIDLAAPVEVEDEVAEFLGRTVHLHLDLKFADLGLALLEGFFRLFRGALSAGGQLVDQTHSLPPRRSMNRIGQSGRSGSRRHPVYGRTRSRIASTLSSPSMGTFSTHPRM